MSNQKPETTATALKPCPFCGGAASLDDLGYCGPADCYDVVVVCDECDARGTTLFVDQHQPGAREFEAEVAAEAVAAWNKRSAESV